MKREEDQIQRAIFRHLRQRPAAGIVAWHTPNGGRRGKAEAGILKALGVLAGVPDVLVLKDCRLYTLELKTRHGRSTPRQKAVQQAMRQAGATVGIAYGLNEALEWLEMHGLLRPNVSLRVAA